MLDDMPADRRLEAAEIGAVATVALLSLIGLLVVFVLFVRVRWLLKGLADCEAALLKCGQLFERRQLAPALLGQLMTAHRVGRCRLGPTVSTSHTEADTAAATLLHDDVDVDTEPYVASPERFVKRKGRKRPRRRMARREDDEDEEEEEEEEEEAAPEQEAAPTPFGELVRVDKMDGFDPINYVPRKNKDDEYATLRGIDSSKLFGPKNPTGQQQQQQQHQGPVAAANEPQYQTLVGVDNAVFDR